ncbi:MAG: penicillin acylase family protein [Bacteroidia bacterium]|nr:penicillin acylase family protein [Bacteroidia bacterium]
MGKTNVILDYDRNQRRLGVVFGAQHALESARQNPAMMKVIEAYTAGVNAYIALLDYEDLAFEYKLLDYAPEQWTPLKCVLLMKSMAQTLNMGDKDIQMTNALKLFGKDMVALLYPDREQVGDAIVEKPGQWNFEAPQLDTIPLAVPEDLIAVTGLSVPDPNIGSNNWAVSGGRTASGAPILCNDPHLDLTLPSIWYVTHLSAPGVNVMGATLPGAPCVVIGFNDSIAWGVTNAQRDLVDWYAMEFNGDKSKYKLDDQWVDIKVVVEELKVRDGATFADSVMYTRWGPVPYDERFRAESARKHYAFRWIAHDGSEDLLTFYQLNRAQNHGQYMNALDHFNSPAQNFAFASVSGDIAMRIQGKFPMRRHLEGKFALDGTRSSNGWQAFIPSRENVMYKNPPRGFVSSANQYPADSTYPYYITATSYEAYRNRRINDVLRADTSVTVEDMMTLQNDTYKPEGIRKPQHAAGKPQPGRDERGGEKGYRPASRVGLPKLDSVRSGRLF